MQPTTVAPISGHVVLDQNFAENRVESMRAMGATNVDPPLARSAFLKNTKTGLILPWSQGLAEQRDIMVNCDANGNTDPVVWMSSVNPVEYSAEEQEGLIQRAMMSLSGYNKHEVPIPDTAMNQPVVFPNGAQRLDEYFSDVNTAVINNMEALLE